MNYHLISALARMRGEDMLREAARRRLLLARPVKRTFRLHVAGAVRRFGLATVGLGDALAGSR